MFAFIWPIGLVVLSNIFYHICAKSVPDNVSPFAALSVTYLIGAAVAFLLHFVIGGGANPMKELAKLNWSSFVLGLAVVGLEVGTIYAYKAGWQISLEAIVQSSFLAIALIIVGYFIFHEALTWNKLAGIGICLVGLVLINLK